MFILDINDKDQTTCACLPVFDQLMTLTYSKSDSKSLSKKSHNITAENGKVNTTLPAKSLENGEINVTASSGKAEKEVNDIMENGTNERREPMVVFIGHSDNEKLGKDKSSELPKFTILPFFGLHPEIRSSKRAKKTRKRWRFVSWRLWPIYMFQKTFWINFGLIRPYRVSQKFVPLI